MSDLGPPYGYALRRNGSCLSTENDCGATWGPWHRCCPSAASCADNCCPEGVDCQQRIGQDPHCANDTATLYRAKGSPEDSPAAGYFCCVASAEGFQDDRSYVGCADSIDAFNANDSYTLASLISSATPSSTSITISSTSVPLATATATPSSDAGSDSSSLSSSSSSTNTGAIAGGVVGGVVGAALILGLLWFLIHRRRKAAQQTQASIPPVAPQMASGPHMTADMGFVPWTQAPQQRIQELQDSKQPPPVQELEGQSEHQVHELPASNR